LTTFCDYQHCIDLVQLQIKFRRLIAVLSFGFGSQKLKF
jgi:hypothetical protein